MRSTGLKPTSLEEKLSTFDPERLLEEASTIPKAWYWDDEIYQRERKAVFLDSWQMVARTSQLQEPGSFVTLDIAGEPVIVTRDKNGSLNAFSNVCRHRAARVATEAEGTANVLRCHYHGWTYDLNGCLMAAPEFMGVCNFQKEDNSLPAWSVETWRQFVFVRSPYGSEKFPSLAEFMAPVDQLNNDAGLESMHFVARKEYIIGCNWKVFVDNYLDGGYHVNTIHPALGGVIDYSKYRTELHPDSSVQISPLKQGEVSNVRSGDCAYYWWLFPNLMINIYEGVMDTNLVLPVGPDSCRVLFDFYFADTEGSKRKRFIEESIAVADRVQIEDLSICEEVQKGLNSQSYDTGRFSVRREAGGYEFHRLLARRLIGKAL